MSVEVRQLGPGDEALLIALANTWKGRAPAGEEAGHFLRQAHHWFLVAFVDEEVVGIAMAYLLDRWDGRPMVCLYELSVLEEHRRRGYGGRLVAEVVRRARASGACKLWVEASDTAAAHRTYLAAGGAPSGVDHLYVWSFEAIERVKSSSS
jgi:GNAT superfamily N-acetyltransferase